jgi:hypothetical protein
MAVVNSGNRQERKSFEVSTLSKAIVKVRWFLRDPQFQGLREAAYAIEHAGRRNAAVGSKKVPQKLAAVVEMAGIHEFCIANCAAESRLVAVNEAKRCAM